MYCLILGGGCVTFLGRLVYAQRKADIPGSVATTCFPRIENSRQGSVLAGRESRRTISEKIAEFFRREQTPNLVSRNEGSASETKRAKTIP